MEARCSQAAKLRADGYAALNGLRLEAAKKAYLRSLELDPNNRGAMYQLDVIEALANDRQVGTSADNDGLYNQAHLSPCQRFEQTKKNGGPEVVTAGSIIAFAKGNAEHKDLLSHDVLQGTATRAIQAVTGCYKSGLKDNPGLRGEATAKLVVEANGSVSAVTLESNTIDEATVERCIESAFSRLQFPARKHSKVALNVLVPLSLQLADGL